MKHSKQLLIFGILAGGILGLIASGPTIYAIVEPHITIIMEPGQITKPLQISDDQGTEVFSINPDGSFTAGNIVVMHFEQKGIITMPLGFRSPALKELAVWKIVKDPAVADNNRIYSDLEVLTGLSKKTQGTSSIQFGIFSSPDGTTWNSEVGSGSSGASFSTFFSSNHQFQLRTDAQFIAFGVRTFNDDTAGEFKDVSGTLIAILPVGYSIEKIL